VGILHRIVLRTAGGRTRARRLLLCSAVVCAGTVPAAATDAAPVVTVHEEAGIYHVVATFSVSQPAAIAHAVLTDYEQIPRFMPDVRTSTVLERTADGLVVEQEATARMMMFSKRIHLVLVVQEAPGTIRFRDRCAKSFELYDGGWTLTSPQAGGTTIEYVLTAKPSFDVPEFLLKRLLKRDSTEMIRRLQVEIASRSR
jgi:ribosome-associated toxin RatA of RatAB toxin-antitoxin module